MIALPRLLYIGDQPIEATVAGPAQLYKLLAEYPPDRLRIVESSIAVSEPATRLPNVRYESVFVGFRRLQNTRFRGKQCSLMYITGGARWPLYARKVSAFAPDAILTISHGSSWVTAAAVARKFGLPLHLILHDDVAAMSGVEPWLRERVYEEFGRVYRQAASRMCIGPMMEAHYREQYRAPGTVLYPTRSADAPVLEGVGFPRRWPLVFAHAGSIHHGGENGDLATVAKALESLGHQLLVYSPSCAEGVAPPGLDRPNVVARPPIPGKDWLLQLRHQADVLVLTMNFNQPKGTQLSFPSKLADYTATGLPILVRAPSDSSITGWARAHPGVAEVVDTPDVEALQASIRRLEDESSRLAMGRAAAAAGDACFSRAAVLRQFYDALLTAGR